MKIHLHVGLAYGGGEEFVKCLASQGDLWRERGLYVPVQRKMRRSISDALNALGGLPPTPSERQAALASFIDQNALSTASRAVFSEQSFLGARAEIFAGERLYENAGQKLSRLMEFFEGHELEVSVALRNPAVLLHIFHHEDKTHEATDAFLERNEPERFSWLPLIRDLKETAGAAPLTVWAYEDRYFLWPRILKSIGVSELTYETPQMLAPFETALQPEGFERMVSYMQKHPPTTDLNFEKAAVSFMDKYARPEVFDEVVDLPDWDNERVTAMSDIYDADMLALSFEEGINFLQPASL